MVNSPLERLVVPGVLISICFLIAHFHAIVLAGNDTGWVLVIPDRYRVGHEAHFAQVTQKYLEYLVKGNMPDWEVPNMIAKYYTTTHALGLADQNRK